jgi:uncharacterized membrane protein
MRWLNGISRPLSCVPPQLAQGGAKLVSRLLHAIGLGIVGAGIVHIAVLLLLPAYSQNDVWSHLSASAQPYTPVRLEASASGRTSTLSNPFLKAAACQFDLADGVLHLSAQSRLPFWSVSIYDPSGLNIVSLTDRAANSPALDLVVASPAQMGRLRIGPPEDLERSAFVETAVEQGFAVVRIFVPDETWEGLADAFLGALTCTPRRLGSEGVG